MNKKWKVFSVIVLLIMGYHQVVAQADVGGSFSGSSSSRGSSSRGGTTTYHSSSHSSYGRHYGSQTSPLVLFVVIGLVTNGFYRHSNQPRYPKKGSRIALAQLRDADPTFKEKDFLNTVQDIFLRVQEAWSAKDMRLVQDVETPELFRLHQSQLERYHQKKWTPHVKTKRITAVRLISFSETVDELSVVICLSSRVVDYTLSRDGLVVEGEKRKVHRRDYRLRFTRIKRGNQNWRLDDYREWMENEFISYR